MPAPKLPSAYTFDRVPSLNIPRAAIRRPSTYKTTFSSGKVYPIFVDEVLPGDTFKLNMSSIARLATPLVPIMDNLKLVFSFFFVPNRLVWDRWVNFMGQQDYPGEDISNMTIPYVTAPVGGAAVGSIADYFGLPTGVKWNNGDVQALPFRAYQLVWNEWFRDENLQTPANIDFSDSSQPLSDFDLLPCNKLHDYFTSCVPSPQKGPSLTLPLSGDVPVVGTGNALGLSRAAGKTNWLLDDRSSAGAHSLAMGIDKTTTAAVGANGSYYSHSSTSSTPATVGVTTNPDLSGLVALTSQATGATINELREAFALQKLLERDMRGGTRYTESIRAHFGVASPDARLQRPELLGTFSVPIVFHTVAQSGGTEENGSVKTPQGNLSAFAMATDVHHAFTKSFVEHGFVLGLCHVRSDLTYQQGIPRMWSRRDRFDIYWPELSHLGEQPVYNKEIYTQGTSADDDVFGYQERFAEYKYGYSKITGELRSTYSAPLDYWHLAQKFDALPTLSDTFIQDTPPVSRVVAVDDAPEFVLDIYNDLTCVRPMPLYAVPGLIDHF
nr:MAG: major capsid protein [Microviridae sp.]